MPPVDFDLWLLVVQLTFQILQYGIFFFKVHFISLQECSLIEIENMAAALKKAKIKHQTIFAWHL
jgi:hypothetical protein